MKRLAFCAIPLICFVACEKGHPPLAPTGVSAATTTQPAPAAAPSTSPASASGTAPARHDKPRIDPDSTGGVRGAQMVTFVVTADTKAAQGARVVVASAGSSPKDENSTNDWGEYHTSLAPGSYRVTVTWRDRTLSKTVKIDPDTQEIDLKLDSPPS
jgi:hypothetical protein